MLTKKAKEYLELKRKQFKDKVDDEEFTSTIVQQSLSGADDKSSSPKLPSLTELCENLNGNLDLFHIEYIYNTIKKLGNFG